MLDERFDPFATKRHRIDAEVQNDFGAVVASEGQRMPGVIEREYVAVAGGEERVTRGIDGHAVAEHAFGKHWVGYFAQRSHPTRKRRSNRKRVHR